VREIVEKIAWRRRGIERSYVGSLVAGSDGIRLSGRDQRTGVDIALAIPLPEVDHVGVEDGDCVVLDLSGSDAILVLPDHHTPIHAQLLARSLGALTRPPALLAEGGSG
jgi:hypothetical protein